MTTKTHLEVHQKRIAIKGRMSQENPPNSKQENEFQEAYKAYANGIYRHCYFRVYNKDLAEDLVQETFIKTWRYISEGKEIKSIKSFLYRVAVNLIIDHSRKKTTLVFDDIKEKEVSMRLYTMEHGILNTMEAQEIIETLEKLDPKYKQVIVMRYVDELSPVEISQILDVSANTVSVRLNYAIKKLKEVIAREKQRHPSQA